MNVIGFMLTGLLFFSHAVCADNYLRQECLLDLKALPEFILNNDAGGNDTFQEKGAVYFSKMLLESEQKITRVNTEKDCSRVLHEYLQAWRKGHLEIETLDVAKANESSASAMAVSHSSSASRSNSNPVPEIKFLSAKTLILRLPNFSPENQTPLNDLLSLHREKLKLTPNWIIDVRGNGGGSDSSFMSLLPWILENETQHIGASWLVTPHNIKAQRNLCEKYAAADANCIRVLSKAAARMESAPTGSFVSQNDKSIISYNAAEKIPHPERVALVIDQGCGSSCEEFVLKLRQSFNVKTIGTRTYGALDYSNLRAYLLPSGKRELWYAISRSNRLPDIKVDGRGIMPDIYFPVPVDDSGKNLYVARIQNWIEGGSLEGIAP